MPKNSNANPLPLFPDLSYTTTDERKYQQQVTSKKNAKKMVSIAPAPVSGPACLRCRHWSRPVDAGDFGMCRALGVAESSSPLGGVDKGDVLPRHEALTVHRIAVEPLRTREAFHCSAYQDVREVAA